MKFRSLVPAALAVLAAVVAGVPAFAQQQPAEAAPPAAPEPPPGPSPAETFDRYNDLIRELREEENRINNERLQRFRAERQAAEARAGEAQRRAQQAQARSEDLDARWEANAQAILDAQARLRQNEGNLGELFGVTRQVAGDVAGVLEQSMLSALEPPPAQGEEGRADFMRRIAAARALPSYEELERLWFELQREMINSGKVQKGQFLVAPREDPAAPGEPTEVVTIGPFVAVTGGEYLGYLPSGQKLAYLTETMPANLRALALSVQAAPPGSYVEAAIDPSRGALLGLYLDRPGVVERIESGEEVAYLILVVGAIGLLVAVFQYFYLIVTAAKIRSQIKRMDQPSKGNPLGRIVLAVNERKDVHDPEIVQLVIADAVLREIPALERFQGFLRLVIAAGPLLGLVGTVIGMIITFKAITAAGSGDPTLMARGIGQAMIATVLGLGVAIPLLFINAALSARSRRIGQTLDEQGFQLLANITGNAEPPPTRTRT